MKSVSLTSGSVSAGFIRLMAPLIAGNILQQFYNTVDALVVGRFVGEKEFAAVGIASSAMNLFLFAAVGACIGISVILARLYGADDLDAFRREHYTAFVGGIAVFAAAAALGCVTAPALLDVLQTPAELKSPTLIYLITVLAALPASYTYNFYSALLRSVGRVMVSLVILAVSVAANLLLALLFIAVLKLGIFGAAAATFLAQCGAAVASRACLARTMPELMFGADDRHFDKALARETLSLAGVTALQQTGLYLGKLCVQSSVNAMGAAYISAYTATTRIEGFANSFGDSGASAASVLVAQNYGARNAKRIRRSAACGFALLSLLGGLSSLLLYLSASPLSAFMLGESGGESFVQAQDYIRTVALFYVLCFIGNAFAGYFDGVGRVRISMCGSLGHIALRIVLSQLLIDSMGLRAVALATGIGWAAANLFWLIKYLRVRKTVAQSCSE